MLCVGLVTCQSAYAQTDISIGYLRVEQPQPPTLSNLDPMPEQIGLAGALTGLQDNQTTGKFLGQSYALNEMTVVLGDDPLPVARAMLEASNFLVLDAPQMSCWRLPICRTLRAQ